MMEKKDGFQPLQTTRSHLQQKKKWSQVIKKLDHIFGREKNGLSAFAKNEITFEVNKKSRLRMSEKN